MDQLTYANLKKEVLNIANKGNYSEYSDIIGAFENAEQATAHESELEIEREPVKNEAPSKRELANKNRII